MWVCVQQRVTHLLGKDVSELLLLQNPISIQCLSTLSYSLLHPAGVPQPKSCVDCIRPCLDLLPGLKR